MEKLKYILAIVVLMIVIFFMIGASIEVKEKEIKKWATEHSYVIKSMDRHLTIFGTPYNYLNKGEYIYEVKLENGDIWWVRTSIFENDYEKETSTDRK